MGERGLEEHEKEGLNGGGGEDTNVTGLWSAEKKVLRDLWRRNMEFYYKKRKK